MEFVIHVSQNMISSSASETKCQMGMSDLVSDTWANPYDSINEHFLTYSCIRGSEASADLEMNVRLIHDFSH